MDCGYACALLRKYMEKVMGMSCDDVLWHHAIFITFANDAMQPILAIAFYTTDLISGAYCVHFCTI